MVFLHIGAMKTGTTFIQNLISENRKSLAEAGYFFPGASWAQQTLATRDILGLTGDPRVKAKASGLWQRLSSKMLAYEGRASIFSMEFLSFTDLEGARRVVRSLEGAEVHVILTVRDTTGALPAQWQSNARNGGKVSWPEFVRGAMRAVRRGERAGGAGGRVFTRAQDIPRILKVWGSLVPPERLHVITVPRTGSDRMLLWQRFATVIGVDPRVCSLPTTRTNSSLGQASADLMRRVNVRLGRVSHSDYAPTMKNVLAIKVLSQRAADEQRAKLDLATRRFAADWNKKVRKAVVKSGAHLVGDLEELPVKVPREFRRDRKAALVDPDPTAILDAAAEARVGMVKLVRRRVRRLAKFGVEVEPVHVGFSDLPSGPKRWDGFEDPVEAAVDEVTALVRRAIELHDRLREVDPKLTPKRERGL